MNFATIGSNFIVDSFVRGAGHDARFNYAAVYSRTRERAIEFADKHGVERIFTSLEELAASPDIDAVYVASPNICHAEQSIMMMEHGKHVLCEKPLAPTREAAQAMINAARSHNVTLLEAMKTTLLPNFQAVREALPKIGTVRRYFAQFCQYSSRYDNFKKGIVMNAFNPELAGGSLLDLGVYGIAPMVHLFGMPSRVQYSGTILPMPGSSLCDRQGVDGQGTLLLTYPQMEGVIMFSKVSDSTIPTEIQGENGRILIKKLSQMVSPYIQYRDGTIEDISRPTIEDNMFYEVKEFIDLISRGQIESDENTFSRSLDVLRITDEAIS